MEVDQDNNKIEEGNEFNELYNAKLLNQPLKNIQDKWKLVPAFLRIRGLVKQHIDSFNYFINSEIKQIVRANALITADADSNRDDLNQFYFKFTDIRVGMPLVKEDCVTHQITPQECRVRDMTYAAPIHVDVEYTKGNHINVASDVLIGHMPMMLGASNCWLSNMKHEDLARIRECPYDPRGYFVVKGVEKVILIQEQMAKNRIIIEVDSKTGNLCAQVTSSTYEKKSRTTVIMKNERFYLKHNLFAEDIPAVLAFKAMGMQCDQEIAQMVGSDTLFLNGIALSLQECSQANVLTEAQALDFIASKLKSQKNASKPWQRIAEVKDIFTNVILAHIPMSKNMPFFAKCRYMGLMIRRIIEASHDPAKLDDKDYYGNKRLELAGQLVSLLFEDLFKKFQYDLKKQIDMNLQRQASRKSKEAFDALSCIRSDHITKGLEIAISSGNWSLKRFKMERQGITQVLTRLSYISTLGMMTRINSQFEKTRKISGPRALQPSQWGMVCPSDTPEGESCGLVKNLALTTHVTTDTPELPLLKLAIDLGMEDAALMSGDELHSNRHALVFMNGQPVGIHNQVDKFVKNLRFLRKRGRIQEFVSIYHNRAQNCVYIAADGGRLVRPLIVCQNGRPLLTQDDINDLVLGLKDFPDFIRQGVIEYMDVNEENNCFIALNELSVQPATTHMEIDPFTILGVVAGLIPYPHHNQSPRNTYQCAMGKQAIGTIGYNQLNRVDTLLYLMSYPQKPMVKTRTIELTNFDELPAGQNASVAIMSFTGYDIEDASILNKASLDRGFGRAVYMRRYQTNLKKYANGTMDIIAQPPTIPPPTDRKANMFKKFKPLDKDGMAHVAQELHDGDIYINKHVPDPATLPKGQVALNQADMDNLEFKSEAQVYKGPSPSYVDRVILTSNFEEKCLIKVMTRQTRIPEIGDKFSSRHGQKGVCGLIVNQEDMPFSERGWCPDFVMNPHGFPSRMTVGKMIELISGKAGVLDGSQKYGTAFGGDKVDEMGQILVQHGFSFDGKDLLMSGTTGEMLPAYVFSGPIFYQRLKHMVQDKMHARARGRYTTLTRQPTEGRSRDGGLRVGEMERDCMIGYGAAALILERLMYSSDAFHVYVCSKCGFIGYQGHCTYCAKASVKAVFDTEAPADPTSDQVDDTMCCVKMPYACKLLLQELQSMNIRTQIKLKNV